MDFTKTIINAIKIWVNKQLSFIENKISDLEDRPSAFIQPEEPNEAPDGTLWIDTDEDSISGVGSNTAESLTFTGVVEATYNGLSPVTVNIPKVTVNGITSDENGNIEIEVGSEQVQTDWNQNDSTQPGYIKNRTHWVEGSTYHTLDDNFIPETIARTSAVEEIKTLVGETSVSEQIEAAIAKIPEVEIPEQVQSNWEQDDEAAVDYIKNKPRVAKKYFIMTDEINGLDYAISMSSGNLVSTLVESYNDISIVVAPNKVDYLEGEMFDPTGMVVVANRVDGSSVEIVEYTYNTDALISGTTSMEIVYMNYGTIYTTTVDITVNSFNSISIETQPTKTVYTEGEVFDPTGMVVVANMDNGETRVIDGYTYSNNQLIYGTESIDITYLGRTTVVSITVLELISKVLVDFEYTDDNAGTITLTGWKETLNGEPSTEMIIPDDSRITL